MINNLKKRWKKNYCLENNNMKVFMMAKLMPLIKFNLILKAFLNTTLIQETNHHNNFTTNRLLSQLSKKLALKKENNQKNK
jgi:hypothetical protein